MERCQFRPCTWLHIVKVSLSEVRWLIDEYRLTSTLSDGFLPSIWNLNRPESNGRRAGANIWRTMTYVHTNSHASWCACVGRIDQTCIYRCMQIYIIAQRCLATFERGDKIKIFTCRELREAERVPLPFIANFPDDKQAAWFVSKPYRWEISSWNDNVNFILYVFELQAE